MDKTLILDSLKHTLDSYFPITQNTWGKFKEICTIKTINKNEIVFDVYSEAKSMTYIYKGLFRSYSTNEKGEEFNKNFFWENRFYAPIVALLADGPITSSVQALESSVVVDIDYKKYRELLFKCEDLKSFQILYLEKHWILDKDDNSYALILEDAEQRYERFLKIFAHILPRISQLNVALYLGISPTHLSRIKKTRKTKN